MSSRFQHNLALLKEHQPDLAAEMESLTPGDHLELAPTKESAPTLLVRGEGDRKVALHSRYTPLKEANRLAESYPADSTLVHVALGFGLGYHLAPYLARLKRLSTLIIIEKDPAVFRLALETIDLRPLLARGKVFFCIGPEPIRYKRVTDANAAAFTINGARLVEHPQSVNLDPEWYAAARANITETTRMGLTEVNTNLKQGRLFQNNVLANLPEFMTCPGVNQLFGSFQDKPAIIVSAGPSLDKNVELLKEAKGRALIICVDTSLRMLLKRGISPDLVISIDPLELTLKHFAGVDEVPEDVCLVFDPEVEPRVPVRYNWNRFVITLSKLPLLKTWEKVCGEKGTLRKGGTVAHAAFYLARATGANPIVFVGQDLAYDPDLGRSHGEGAALGGAVRLDPDDPEFLLMPVPTRPGQTTRVKPIWVPGVNKERVPTVANMFAYLRIFEREIGDTPARCIDATEGGARIAGTDVMTLREVIDTCCPEPWDVTALLHRLAEAPSAEVLRRAMETAERVVESLEKGREMAAKAKRRSHEILDQISGNSLTPKGHELAQRVVALEKELNSVPHLGELVMPTMHVPRLNMTKQRVKFESERTAENVRALYLAQEAFYTEFEISCAYLSPAAGFARDRMEKILRLYGVERDPETVEAAV